MEKEVVFAGILSNKVEQNPGKDNMSRRFEAINFFSCPFKVVLDLTLIDAPY